MNRTRWLRGLALALVLVTVMVVGRDVLRSDGAPDDVERDRALVELAELREAVAECNVEVAEEQARFQAHEARVDSLRAIVEHYESDERTVPAEDYEAYLEAFDAHNEAVAAWHERAEALEDTWAECRALTERHNELVESLSPPGGGGTVQPRPPAPDAQSPPSSAQAG